MTKLIPTSEAKKILSSRASILTCNEYKENKYDNKWNASSPYLVLGGGDVNNMIDNNIAYYISGTKFACNEFKIILNVNNLLNSLAAKMFFVACAKDVFNTFASEGLANEFIECITSATGKNATLSKRYEGVYISVTQELFSESRTEGYVINFVIKYARIV